MKRYNVVGMSRFARFGIKDPHGVERLRTSRGGVRL